MEKGPWGLRRGIRASDGVRGEMEKVGRWLIRSGIHLNIYMPFLYDASSHHFEEKKVCQKLHLEAIFFLRRHSMPFLLEKVIQNLRKKPGVLQQ